MRAVAANFNFDLLEESVKLAHSQGVKIYLTCNTIPLNDEGCKVEGIFAKCARNWSWRANCGWFGCFFWSQKGCAKAKFACFYSIWSCQPQNSERAFRAWSEASGFSKEAFTGGIKTIRQQTPKELELECFVHGAMCVSFSGRCLISQYMLGRDANKGAQCA